MWTKFNLNFLRLKYDLNYIFIVNYNASLIMYNIFNSTTTLPLTTFYSNVSNFINLTTNKDAILSNNSSLLLVENNVAENQPVIHNQNITDFVIFYMY